jgi:hypothetical protein
MRQTDKAQRLFFANGTSRRSSTFHLLSSAICSIYVKRLGVIAFQLGTTVAATAEMIPMPRARPVDIPGDQSSTPRTEAVVSTCQSRLAEVAAFKPLPPITGPGIAPQRMWSHWMRCSRRASKRKNGHPNPRFLIKINAVREYTGRDYFEKGRR